MKRVGIDLCQVAEFKNLASAFHKAAKGKRQRPNVLAFSNNFEDNLNQLAEDIGNEKLPYGRYREFTIYDPKKRLIHAACFEDRIFHHALMNLAAPVLEKAMVDTSYACRPGMGVHQAVSKVQQHLRRFPFFVKVDIDGYFASISHSLLREVLARRFKGGECERQIQRILHSYHAKPGVGLPIGALTSQYFANYFLDGLDRYMASQPQICAQVRYMDDIIWWVRDKSAAYASLAQVKAFVHSLSLEVKPNIQIQASNKGVTYCGFRVFPGHIGLTQRKKKRYQERRLYWETLFKQGEISELQLQQAYSAVHSLCSGCDSDAWRKRNLALHPPPEL